LCAPRVLAAPHPDHHEFDAAVHAPYDGAAGVARDVSLQFRFPDADALIAAAWRLDVLDARGARVRTFHGETALQRGEGQQRLTWDAKDSRGAPVAEGFYTLRLTAQPVPLSDVLARGGTPAAARVERILASGADQAEER